MKYLNIIYFKKFLPLIMFVATLFMCVGFAAINSIVIKYDGLAVAKRQDAVFITKVEYVNNDDVSNDGYDIVYADKTILNSKINLDEDNANSELSLKLSFYNSSSSDYIFKDVIFADDLDLEDVYSNLDITYTFDKQNEIISKNGGTMDVVITFKYDNLDEDTSNVLNSLLNFKFEIVKYVNVKFDANGGNVSTSSKTVIVNNPYGDLPVPTREGYTFSGWSFEKSSKEIVLENNIVSNESEHTLYAQWKASTQYTITYHANASDSYFNGWAKQITELKTHDTPCVISTPTDLNISRGDKWIWTEWNTKADGSGDTYLGANVYSTNADLTLYAIWSTKTNTTVGSPNWVNVGDPSVIPGKDEYNFTVKFKTQGGADGIAIPIHNLIPNYAYRLTFSVTFNDFQFYTEDSGSYIFGTNIIDSYENYHTNESIMAKAGATVTHRHENMQWSTESSGTYNVFLDFVPNKETMYWFWETTDIVDYYEMIYQFNNFNIQMLDDTGEYGPRVAFEDLTVKFATAPFINVVFGSNPLTGVATPVNLSTNTYGTRWIDYKNANGEELTARHKNYFHTEEYSFTHLNYRIWGYDGHEVMTIPLVGLTVGKQYKISFKQDLTNAIVYNTNSSALNTIQLYGCAVTESSNMDANYTTSNSVNYQSNYQDLRKARVGANSSQSIVFTATADTMYWQWLLGDLKDGPAAGWRYSDVRLYDVVIEQQ